MINVAQGQVPAAKFDDSKVTDPLTKQLVVGWNQLVNDDGLTLFPDLASPNMFTTLGSNFDDVLAGKTTPAKVLKNAQADWKQYDSTLR